MAITTLPIVPRDPLKWFSWLNTLRSWLHSTSITPQVNHAIFEELHEEPEKLINGMVVFADGTDWKPDGTGGRGMYRYDTATTVWEFLG